MFPSARTAAAAFSLSICALSLCGGGISPETGSYFIQSWAPKTYGASWSPQNWAIAQDHRGVMYFGNTDGLLEYDGVSWRKMRIAGSSAVRSLAVDDKGTVFVGAQRDFGYLQPGANGEMQYVSILKSKPGAEFADVWTIVPTPQGVYFGASRKIFRWTQGALKSWDPPQGLRFGRIYIQGDMPYVPITKQGLFQLEHDEWKLASGGDAFAGEDVRGVYNVGGSLLVVTREGLFKQVADKFEKIEAASRPLKDAQIYSSLLLANGDLALASSRAGLLLVNTSGQVERAISTPELPTEKINALFTDRQGALWLGLESGIALLDPRLSQFDKRSELEGNVFSIARGENSLYAGTSIGAFRLLRSGAAVPSFEPVGGVEGTVMAMLPAPGGILIAGQHWVYQMEKNQPKPVLRADSVVDLQPSPRDPNVVYAAGKDELYLIRRDRNEWRKEREVPSGANDFRSVTEDSDGRVWATSRFDIARIDLRSDPPIVERFDKKNGVPDGWKNVYVVNGRLYFATAKGLMHFDATDKQFKPDATLGEIFADGSRGVSVLRENSNGDIWVTGEGYQGILERRPGGGYDWNPMPLLRTGIGEMYALWLDPDGVAWAAGQDGWLVRYESPAVRPAQDFSVLLRRVSGIGADASLYDGAGANPQKLDLAYRDNSLRFEFAAPAYDAEGTTEYQVKLDGENRGWSPWSKETRKDYTNLLEGSYQFHVRARSPRGMIAEASGFVFRVSPPWYRTWWAALIYLAATAAAIWLLLKWRLAQLSARNQQLEATVVERTAEIRRQRDQIQLEEEETKRLLLNILPAPVAEELRATGTVAPMVYNEVTVCFTDFAGFTLSAEKLPAPLLVSTLHEYFTEFDKIVTRYGLEKLKTIGDSYMFVSGLPSARRAHALDATMAAMEMVELCQRLEREAPVAWKIRIGLHTGPVIAGIVGVKKFAYDVWGNAVNLASRMESSGESDRVNISARTYECVREFIDCEPRGLVPTKDGRALEMYFTRGLRSDVSDPAAFAARYREVFSEEPLIVPREIAGDKRRSPALLRPQ